MARLLLPIIGIGLMIFLAGDLNPAVMKAAAVGAVGGIVVLGPLHHDAGVRAGLSRHRRLAAAGLALPAVRAQLDPDLSRHILDQRHQTIAVVRHGWLSMTFGLVGFFGVNYVLFWFCQNTVGVQPPFAYMVLRVRAEPAADQCHGDSGRGGCLGDRGRRPACRGGANPAQATAGVVLYSLYVHFLEVPLRALGWLAWWVGPKVDPKGVVAPRRRPVPQPQGGSSSTTSGTKT